MCFSCVSLVSPNATTTLLCIHHYIHAVCCPSGRAVLLCCVVCRVILNRVCVLSSAVRTLLDVVKVVLLFAR